MDNIKGQIKQESALQNARQLIEVRILFMALRLGY